MRTITRGPAAHDHSRTGPFGACLGLGARVRRTPLLALAALALGSGCAGASHDLGPERMDPPPAGVTASELLADADAAWERRADPAQARRAEFLYLTAAAADDTRVEGLLGAARARSIRIEAEASESVRAKLAASAVQLGEICKRRAPASAACDYRLAVALGQQARARSPASSEAAARAIELLRSAARADPNLDEGGPHRELALALLRAPPRPGGPGDAEQGLAAASRALALFPNSPANLLALGAALERNGDSFGAREAYASAGRQARAAAERGLPEAERWAAEAKAALAR